MKYWYPIAALLFAISAWLILAPAQASDTTSVFFNDGDLTYTTIPIKPDPEAIDVKIPTGKVARCGRPINGSYECDFTEDISDPLGYGCIWINGYGVWVCP